MGPRIRMEGRFRAHPRLADKTGSYRAVGASPRPDACFRVLRAGILLGASGYLWLLANHHGFSLKRLFTVCCHAYNTAHLFPYFIAHCFVINAESCSPFKFTSLGFRGVQLGWPPWAATHWRLSVRYLPHGSVIICWVVWLFQSL